MWKANRRSQFHHCLVEIAGAIGIKQLSGEFPHFFATDMFAGDSAQHTLHVAIHDRDWFLEGNAGDGGSCVPSNPGEITQLSGCWRKVALMLSHDFFSRGMKHASAAIITKAAPCGEHRGLPRLG